MRLQYKKGQIIFNEVMKEVMQHDPRGTKPSERWTLEAGEATCEMNVKQPLTFRNPILNSNPGTGCHSIKSSSIGERLRNKTEKVPDEDLSTRTLPLVLKYDHV